MREPLRSWMTYSFELAARGTVVLPPGALFSPGEVVALERLQAQLPEEKVTAGDAGDTHDIFVRRIMVDRAGELPAIVNGPTAETIVSVLETAARKRVLTALFGEDLVLRRCQINRMVAGSFIGLHLDAESNPDYEISVIVQLGRKFEGGAFVVHPPHGTEQVYTPTYGTVVITTCKYRHEVTRVLANERTSLVYFYARHAGKNRRAD